MNIKLFISALYTVLLILLCCIVHAQQPYIDLLDLEYYSLPMQVKAAGENQNISASWVKASVQAPIKIKEDYLIIQPSYEQYNFNLSSSPTMNLYGVSLPLTYVKQWNSKQWQTAFTAIPRVSSDFKNISGDDYQFGGALVAIYKKSETLDYKFGVYYNSEYFGPFFWPLLGIDWKINDKLTLFGVLPASMNLEYKLRNNIYAGAAFLTVTNSYRLSNNDWIKIEDNHLKLYVDYYLAGNFVLTAEGGYSVMRKYTYGLNDDNSELNMQYQDGPIFKAGIAWRMRMDGKGK